MCVWARARVCVLWQAVWEELNRDYLEKQAEKKRNLVRVTD